ncbi:hypothetical protein NDU88_005798 [Pleurodeles waltl]|uniref:Uncharacterized protein n=1 Tax=Pleurodeles waltl TaxID=8319 RepID=A0AAV7SMN6_PLEWA|nr:hypothetical protein NDU88_005798 [Pleurodeles waltl]
MEKRLFSLGNISEFRSAWFWGLLKNRDLDCRLHLNISGGDGLYSCIHEFDVDCKGGEGVGFETLWRLRQCASLRIKKEAKRKIPDFIDGSFH